MQFLIKQAVCLDGKDYPRGAHELSGAVLSNETFKKFLKLGLIIQQSPKSEPAASAVVVEETSKKSKKQK